MENLIKKLNINEEYTKATKQKIFNKVKDNVPHVEDYNFMADLLLLPETKKGFKYLLVVVDLGNDDFDIEPLKNKDSKSVLTGFTNMFKRPYIKKPYASIRTDAGTEFKDEFHKYLYENSIMHKVAEPNRHQQLANVESLNKQLGRLFNGYMNSVEAKTNKVYKEWDDVIDIVRKDLNEYRKKPTKNRFTEIYPVPEVVEPKYKVGDLVYYKLNWAESQLGHKQPTPNFRMGDVRYKTVPTKIMKVLHYSGKVPIRYLLNGKLNVSYAESELLPAKEKEEKFVVRQIFDKKTVNKKIYYKVWWKTYKKADSTWELKNDLIKDGLQEYIDEFEDS
jgi:Chromo (CHRromatin Organisation MOdifier) domain